ncbi:MAG: SO_0444 family Cu/Zn efflux transporter [Phycisphaerae bacterium]
MVSVAWDILCESAFFILVGFAFAGVLKVLISGEAVTRYLSGTRKRSVFLATLVGAPLPLCSCSVLPAAVTLRKKGASKGATLSFLISTPETSATSFLLTYALLGPLMAILRPIAACITAIAAGLADNFIEKRYPSPEPKEEAGEPPCGMDSGKQPATDTASSRFRKGMRFAFVELFDDIFGWILIGILAAAAIQAWLPPDVLNNILGGPLQSMLLMVLIGVPLYVCAESSTPIAAVFIAQGMNPGAALVFLLVGPATNIGSLGVLHRQLGRRTVVVYLATIILVAMFLGRLLNALLKSSQVGLTMRVLDEPLIPQWLKAIGALVFLSIGAISIGRLRYIQRLSTWLSLKLPVPISPRSVEVVGAVFVTCVYVGSGFFTILPGEVGIVRRFGAIQHSDLPPGLHYALPYPIDEVDRVAVQRVYRLVIGYQPEPWTDPIDNSNPKESWHLVGDENIADIKMAVHWGAAEDKVTCFQYGVADREELVRNVVLGTARELLGGASINTVFTANRQRHEQEIKRLAQQRLVAYDSGIRIQSFHILDAHAPQEVHAAFRDVASALEDRATRIDQARAQEAQIIPKARGEAAQQIAEAQGYVSETVLLAKGQADRFLSLLKAYAASPEVTGLRLELEMLEQVLPRLRKYLKPPTADAGELEIWFVEPNAANEVSRGAPGR